MIRPMSYTIESADFKSRAASTVALDMTETTLLLFFIGGARKLSTFREIQQSYNVVNTKIQGNSKVFSSWAAPHRIACKRRCADEKVVLIKNFKKISLSKQFECLELDVQPALASLYMVWSEVGSSYIYIPETCYSM